MSAGLLRADVSSGHRAPARFWTVGSKASHGNGRLLDACFRVFALREKENFQLFHFVLPLKLVHFLRLCLLPRTTSRRTFFSISNSGISHIVESHSISRCPSGHAELFDKSPLPKLLQVYFLSFGSSREKTFYASWKREVFHNFTLSTSLWSPLVESDHRKQSVSPSNRFGT